jgi:hypothetical protein
MLKASVGWLIGSARAAPASTASAKKMREKPMRTDMKIPCRGCSEYSRRRADHH